ncbi:MAG: AAA family ATPase, partial [Candidatus Electrothrix sp. MAN1_4]|nr:AAA family ATPase [Candidatus Electrothrix sp. MAN1_4]
VWCLVRELIVNAFMHRDWSIFGQRIRLNIFADRLEVFSPGSLPNTLNLTRALSGISYYRNPIISQMLKDYKMADRVGRGLQKVVNYYQERGLRPPVFDVEHASFRVTLWEAGVKRD